LSSSGRLSAYDDLYASFCSRLRSLRVPRYFMLTGFLLNAVVVNDRYGRFPYRVRSFCASTDLADATISFDSRVYEDESTGKSDRRYATGGGTYLPQSANVGAHDQAIAPTNRSSTITASARSAAPGLMPLFMYIDRRPWNWSPVMGMSFISSPSSSSGPMCS